MHRMASRNPDSPTIQTVFGISGNICRARCIHPQYGPPPIPRSRRGRDRITGEKRGRTRVGNEDGIKEIQKIWLFDGEYWRTQFRLNILCVQTGNVP